MTLPEGGLTYDELSPNSKALTNRALAGRGTIGTFNTCAQVRIERCDSRIDGHPSDWIDTNRKEIRASVPRLRLPVKDSGRY